MEPVAEFGDFRIISTLGKDPTGKAKVYKVERKTDKVGCLGNSLLF
jgi:hypothetical protein